MLICVSLFPFPLMLMIPGPPLSVIPCALTSFLVDLSLSRNDLTFLPPYPSGLSLALCAAKFLPERPSLLFHFVQSFLCVLVSLAPVRIHGTW